MCVCSEGIVSKEPVVSSLSPELSQNQNIWCLSLSS